MPPRPPAPPHAAAARLHIAKDAPRIRGRMEGRTHPPPPTPCPARRRGGGGEGVAMPGRGDAHSPSHWVPVRPSATLCARLGMGMGWGQPPAQPVGPGAGPGPGSTPGSTLGSTPVFTRSPSRAGVSRGRPPSPEASSRAPPSPALQWSTPAGPEQRRDAPRRAPHRTPAARQHDSHPSSRCEYSAVSDTRPRVRPCRAVPRLAAPHRTATDIASAPPAATASV